MILSKKKYFLLLLCILGLGFSMSCVIPSSYALFKTSQEVEGSIVVQENNYCINQGFNKLSECMLVMENYSTSVQGAKEYINSKGSGSFSKMAPTITYKETTTNVSNENGVLSTTAHYTLGKGYTFNSSTGIFTLTTYTNNPLSDDYIDYYTCGSTTGTYTSCSTMYQIKAYKITTSGTNTNYVITSVVRHNYSAIDALDSEIGLYSAEDDDGSSYYYRGNVKNNYVSYAGYTWRIVRENGDGSIRLIYSGTSPSATGSATSIGTSAFNSKYYDPTYVGYQYNENFALNETGNSSSGSYNNFNENVSYYFGAGYTFDETTKKFQLSGDMIQGTWKDKATEAIASYPYTCFSTSATGTCNVLIKTLKYTNSYTANVHLISYSSKDYDSTLQNTTDSTIKGKIDSWYKTNILNKTDSSGNYYSQYLSDNSFCNDRSLISGSGYLLAPTTTYGAYNRLYTKKSPTLKCSQSSDKFSVTAAKGNASLTYPVGLITADEAAMAGGLYSAVNTQYYLYTGQTYWTLSPSRFYSWNAYARAWLVYSTGYLFNAWVAYSCGVRPVVNLSADVLISGGDGTAINPYVVTLS